MQSLRKRTRRLRENKQSVSGSAGSPSVNDVRRPFLRRIFAYESNWSSGNRKSDESAARVAQLRTVDVARLHPPRPADDRQAEEHDRGWFAWDDFESLDF